MNDRTFFIVCGVALTMVVVGSCAPRDSTDVPDGRRSGMGLRIDYATGCHYLTTPAFFGEGGITPRLREDGSHVCTGLEKPNDP